MSLEIDTSIVHNGVGLIRPVRMLSLHATLEGYMKHRILLGLIAAALAPNTQALDLVSAYEKAFAYDSGLAQSRANLNSQLAQSDQALAPLLPKIDAFGQAQYTDRNGKIEGLSGSGAVGSGTSNTSGDEAWWATRVGVQLTQPLFRASLWFDYQASQYSADQAEAAYSLAQQSLILSVSEAYFNVLRGEDNLATARATEAALKRQWEQAKERFNVGLIAVTEVQEARASYDASKTQRIAADNQLDVAREALARLTGDYTEQVNKLQTQFPITPPAPADMDQWVKTANLQNWSIKAAEQQLLALNENVSSAKSGHVPTLDLSTSYSRLKLNGLGPFDQIQQDAVIGVSLNVPLYAGGGTEAGVRRARADQEAAQQNLNTTRRNVNLDTRSLYRTLNTDIESVAAARQTIVSRNSALEATRAGYSVGTRNIVEVLDAEQNFYIALRDYANARYDYVLNGLRLKQAAGTLSPEDIFALNQWLSASAPGIEALANEPDKPGSTP